ncbi:MAG: DUF3343 domain-containing protein [Clostridiaceae bacterium]|nr:DUF3343 domain-containing protein [Clostridiaceae bacterium]
MINPLQIPDFMLASFDTAHDAMRAEQLSKEAGIKARLIPTPEIVRAGCGLSLRMEPEAAAAVAGILEGEKIKVTHWTLSATRDGRRQFIGRKSPLAARDEE